MGLTSIFWREAWKYRDRAYRYCCHDLGHAMMSLLLAARALGVSGGAIAHFGDLRLTHALGLTGGDEAPMTFLVFPSDKFRRTSTRPRFQRKHSLEFPMNCRRKKFLTNCCSKCIARQSCVIPRARRLLPPANAAAEDRTPLPESLPEPARDAPLGEIVRRRRSALDFDPRTPPMERADAEQILDFATRDWPADWRGNFRGANGSS